MLLPAVGPSAEREFDGAGLVEQLWAIPPTQADRQYVVTVASSPNRAAEPSLLDRVRWRDPAAAATPAAATTGVALQLSLGGAAADGLAGTPRLLQASASVGVRFVNPR